MCLVEVKGSAEAGGAPAPWACATCRPGPERRAAGRHTKTPMVKKAREGVMEFLLINHPLDCPICDQGGECDLQDQAMAYGVDGRASREQARGRRQIYRPARQDDHDALHPLHALRPLHRRSRGVPEMGAIGRGEDMEITTYLERR
jgi:NADH-quinone oxidoreductase subunit G